MLDKSSISSSCSSGLRKDVYYCDPSCSQAILGNLFGQCFVYSVVRKGSMLSRMSIFILGDIFVLRASLTECTYATHFLRQHCSPHF